MTHYDLLGLRPEARAAEVQDAIATARVSWERRRDAAADSGAFDRALAALARLDEAARDLATSESRCRYDETALPLETLLRVRALRAHRGAPAEADPAIWPTEPEEAADPRLREEAEQAIRAEAERRRELRRQEEELAASSPYSSPGPVPLLEPGAQTGSVDISAAVDAAGTDLGTAAHAGPEGRPARKRKARSAARPERASWRSAGLLAAATLLGVAIALIPVALVVRRGTGPRLTSAPATASTPIALPAPSGAATPVPAFSAAAATAAIAGAATATGAMVAREPTGATSAPVAAPISVSATSTATETATSSATATATVGATWAALLRRAYAAYAAGRYQESLDLYDRALAPKPDDPVARVGRALTLLALGKPHAAELECRTAIRVKPDFPEAHFNLGVALHRQHKEAEAVAAFRRFVELAPDDRAAPQARGFIARWNLAQKKNRP